MIKQEFLERINALPDVFMLASLVQFKYVQTISERSECFCDFAYAAAAVHALDREKIGRAHV